MGTEEKIERIARGIANGRTAKLVLDYNNIKNTEEGLYITLEGDIEYGGIEDALTSEIQNLNQAAHDFSRDLLSAKDSIPELKRIDAKDIDISQYQIHYDSASSHFSLFIPWSALDSKARKQKEDMQNGFKGNNEFKSIIMQIKARFLQLINENKSEKIRTDESYGATQLLLNIGRMEETYDLKLTGDASSFGDFLTTDEIAKGAVGLNVRCIIDRSFNKSNTIIYSIPTLVITCKGKTLYNKCVKLRFYLDAYIGDTINEFNTMENGEVKMLQIQCDEDEKHSFEDNRKNLKKLDDSLRQKEKLAVDKFEEDLKKEFSSE